MNLKVQLQKEFEPTVHRGEHPYIDVVDNRADFETKVRIQWVRPNWVRVKAVSKFQHQLKYLGQFLSSILLHKVTG